MHRARVVVPCKKKRDSARLGASQAATDAVPNDASAPSAPQAADDSKPVKRGGWMVKALLLASLVLDPDKQEEAAQFAMCLQKQGDAL